MTPTNQILDELHAARAKLLADAEGDLHTYLEGGRQRTLASGIPIAEPVQRHPQKSASDPCILTSAKRRTDSE